jgi:hypothetical protein
VQHIQRTHLGPTFAGARSSASSAENEEGVLGTFKCAHSFRVYACVNAYRTATVGVRMARFEQRLIAAAAQNFEHLLYEMVVSAMFTHGMRITMAVCADAMAESATHFHVSELLIFSISAHT